MIFAILDAAVVLSVFFLHIQPGFLAEICWIKKIGSRDDVSEGLNFYLNFTTISIFIFKDRGVPCKYKALFKDK